MSRGMSFAYVRDPNNKDRVVTIGWNAPDANEPDTICYSLTVNKVVSKAEYALDGRLATVMSPTEFKTLQKAMRVRYGGDNHCKAQARKKVAGMMRSARHWLVKINKDLSTVPQIIKDFVDMELGRGEPRHVREAYRIFCDVIARDSKPEVCDKEE